MIRIIPAIDILGGRCVRLTRGDYAQAKTYDADPVAMARRLADCGVTRLHLVDLDGARTSTPCNLAMLEAVARKVSCELEWGGGIASGDDLRRVFEAGATHAIVGSVAALQPDLFQEWLERYGARMILGADVRDGRIAVKGWLETAAVTAEALIGRFPGLCEAICTDIRRDGMLHGTSDALYVALQQAFPSIDITVSGGVATMDDIRRLDGLGLRRIIVGKAIYENRISLQDITLWSQNASSPASTSKTDR